MKLLIGSIVVLAAAAGTVHQVGEAVERMRDQVSGCPAGWIRVAAVVVPAGADPEEELARMPRCVPPFPSEREIDPGAPRPPVIEEDRSGDADLQD